MKNDERMALFTIRDNTTAIKNSLQEMLRMQKARQSNNLSMTLPDHLRKTMIALRDIDIGTANEVAELTGRARAVESGYLNQLAVNGYIEKLPRDGRKQPFKFIR